MSNTITVNLVSSDVLLRAAELVKEIEEKQAELNELGVTIAGALPVGTTVPTAHRTVTTVKHDASGKRVFPQESRDRIAAAQRKRWREARKAKAAAAAAAQSTAPTPTVVTPEATTAPAAPAPAPTPAPTAAPVAANPPQATPIPAPQKQGKGKSEKAALIAA